MPCKRASRGGSVMLRSRLTSIHTKTTPRRRSIPHPPSLSGTKQSGRTAVCRGGSRTALSPSFRNSIQSPQPFPPPSGNPDAGRAACRGNPRGCPGAGPHPFTRTPSIIASTAKHSRGRAMVILSAAKNLFPQRTRPSYPQTPSVARLPVCPLPQPSCAVGTVREPPSP